MRFDGNGGAATRLVWDPLGTSGYVDVLAETDAAEALVREYWRGARLAVFKSPSTKGAYLFDHLGNTEGVLNAMQNFVVGYLYSAWGEGLKTTGGLAQAWQFGGDWGAWREALRADLWMRARVMQPTVGRFLGVDPLSLAPIGQAPYWYVANTPTRLVDPSGLQSHGPNTGGSCHDACMKEILGGFDASAYFRGICLSGVGVGLGMIIGIPFWFFLAGGQVLTFLMVDTFCEEDCRRQRDPYPVPPSRPPSCIAPHGVNDCFDLCPTRRSCFKCCHIALSREQSGSAQAIGAALCEDYCSLKPEYLHMRG